MAAPMATAATAVSIRAGTGPIGVAVNPQTGTVDVAISGSNNVSVISG